MHRILWSRQPTLAGILKLPVTSQWAYSRTFDASLCAVIVVVQRALAWLDVIQTRGCEPLLQAVHSHQEL